MILMSQTKIILCCYCILIAAQAILTSVKKHAINTTRTAILTSVEKRGKNTASKSLFNSTEIDREPHYSRIIGGQKIIENVEYMVSIQTDQIHRCGGTLISRYWILTAAQCVIDKYDGQVLILVGKIFNVMIGALSLRSKDNYKAVCEKVHVHPEFKNFSIINNIALMKMSMPCPQDNYMTLANDNDIKRFFNSESQICKIMGWGHNELDDIPDYGPYKYSDTLLEASVTLIKDECLNYYAGMNLETHLCTLESGKFFRTADIGGPLICDGKQFGIAIYTEYSEKKKPDVYIKVSKYLQWIRGVMSCSNNLPNVSYFVLCFIIIINLLIL